MEYKRITSIDSPLFKQMYKLLQQVFPKEEVLAFDLWKEPLEDPSIRVFVAIHEGEVVGTTEYRYYPQMNVGMTDFTIIGREQLGVGPFLAKQRAIDLKDVAASYGKQMDGMFAEIYDPYEVEAHSFGGINVMNPFVRREVLSHLGYKRLDFDYVHPSWELDGSAVSGLDLCYLPTDETLNYIDSALIVEFLTTYYEVLPEKPQQWLKMMEQLKTSTRTALKPL